MDLQTLAKYVILVGVSLVIVGAVLWAGAKLGLGSLPGDIRIEGKSGSIYFPLATSILLSIVLTIVLNLILRWFRK